MTDKKGTRAADRHGREISAGDVVELVFGGQRFHMAVESIEPHQAAPDVPEIAHLTGTVELTVPAHSTTRRKSSDPPRPTTDGDDKPARPPTSPKGGKK